MAVVEEGGSGRSPAKAKPKSSLKKWDDGPVLAQANPMPRPTRSNPLAGTPFDQSRLTTLTPYVASVPEPEAEVPEGRDAIYGVQMRTPSWGPSGTGPAAEAAQEKAKADVAPVEEPKKRGGRAYQLTWDEYNKLSDDKRAAVDFNTMLLQAREKDLNADYDALPGGGRNAEYDAAVERMFGEGGGSETYAPETMAVLRSIDFKATGETLDDFLDLNAAVSAKELKDFSTELQPLEGPLGEMTGADQALTSEQKAATYTQDLQQALAKGGKLIQHFRASAAMDRSPLAVRYGGTANKAAPALGFGDDEDSKYFRMATDALSRDLSPEDLDQVWNALNERFKPEQLVAFKKYADDITRDAISFRPPEWAQAEGVYFNPQLIRDRLGLDRGER